MKAYQEFANFYDFLMKDAPYSKWLDLINLAIETMVIDNRKALNQGTLKALRIVDIGCGTGTVCTMLAESGHHLWGVDLSDEMLSIAEQKRSQLSLPMRRRINFLCEDMKELHLPEPVDIAYSFCDSINYLDSLEAVNVTFSQVHSNLKADGLFIFDLLSLHKMENQLHDSKSFEVSEDVICIWQNNWDKQKQELHYDVVLLTKESEHSYRRHDEYHIQKSFSIDEIRNLLQSNGFEIVKEFADFIIHKPIEDALDRYFWIAKKV